ncbi:hypothetical protein UFOVP965_68 [uncultured Caudovirales phage]|uniref:Uncharacterized protein n=1 Tax=uncultured Caudovirales phage TaxID=2100421 RepID=A0A6J5R4E1_9CAUD|nr:hypothetical protein UFOVP965_68 [uncultured Caudovirales phage]CAB4179816.1 hypothetical protein UFOVP1035_64 [uncultured Caudovirales phage]CAB4188451.1 hypothetical protein UFOVP1181_23 [uncultured Caudovirales phage]
MSEPKNSLPSMETSAARGFKNASAEPSKNTKSVKKGHSKSVDPAKSSTGARSAVTSPNAKGRNGATYGIKVKFQQSMAPEAGATQGNGRILAPAINRQRPNFSDGMSE